MVKMGVRTRNEHLLLIGAGLFLSTLALSYSQCASAVELRTNWRDQSQVTSDRIWNSGDFNKLKRKSYRDKDPETGTERAWDGVLLSDILNQSLAGLALSQQAAVDLLVIRSKEGKQTYIPRVFTEKYPVLLALEGNPPTQIGTMVPLQTLPKIRNERLPVESYFLRDIHSIEFTTYQTVFGSFYLKRRTDPRSVRGEAYVVKNCLSCHGAENSGAAPVAGIFARPDSGLHPKVVGYREPVEDERRAIASYLNARKAEAPKPN